MFRHGRITIIVYILAGDTKKVKDYVRRPGGNGEK